MRKNINYKPSKHQAAMSFAVGILFIILGVTMVIPMTFGSGILPIGLFGLAWTGIAAYNVVINAKYLFGEKKEENENLFGGYEVTEDLPEEVTHDHIPSTALDAKGRLEQLETLKDAGLLTDEEYRAKRKDILSGL